MVVFEGLQVGGSKNFENKKFHLHDPCMSFLQMTHFFGFAKHPDHVCLSAVLSFLAILLWQGSGVGDRPERLIACPLEDQRFFPTAKKGRNVWPGFANFRWCFLPLACLKEIWIYFCLRFLNKRQLMFIHAEVVLCLPTISSCFWEENFSWNIFKDASSAW